MERNANKLKRAISSVINPTIWNIAYARVKISTSQRLNWNTRRHIMENVFIKTDRGAWHVES